MAHALLSFVAVLDFFLGFRSSHMISTVGLFQFCNTNIRRNPGGFSSRHVPKVPGQFQERVHSHYCSMTRHSDLMRKPQVFSKCTDRSRGGTDKKRSGKTHSKADSLCVWYLHKDPVAALWPGESHITLKVNL